MDPFHASCETKTSVRAFCLSIRTRPVNCNVNSQTASSAPKRSARFLPKKKSYGKSSARVVEQTNRKVIRRSHGRERIGAPNGRQRQLLSFFPSASTLLLPMKHLCVKRQRVSAHGVPIPAALLLGSLPSMTPAPDRLGFTANYMEKAAFPSALQIKSVDAEKRIKMRDHVVHHRLHRPPPLQIL